MVDALHQFRDFIYKKGFDIGIPLAIKLNLTPNQITVLRFLLLIPPCTFLFSLNNYPGNILAIVIYHLFCFLDLLDGKVAAARKMCTRLGEIIDPILDHIGHGIIFTGIIIGILVSNSVFEIDFLSVSIPTQFLFLCGILSIMGMSIPLIFSIQPPTRFFMIRDLHDLHEDFFPKNRIKSDSEPIKIWLTKNIICPHNFPFNMIFKIGPLLTISALLNILPISLVIFAITLNMRTVSLFYYFFKIFSKQKLSA